MDDDFQMWLKPEYKPKADPPFGFAGGEMGFSPGEFSVIIVPPRTEPRGRPLYAASID